MATVDVKISNFEGPLDLLLHLIEKNKYSIFDIPIVEITEQYLAYLDDLKEDDYDRMSDFLLMAAQLISIKAKMLLPKEEEEVLEEGDPRDELVQRLLQYKMYKFASYELKDMEMDAEGAYFKGESIPKEVKDYKEEVDPAEIVKDLTLVKLKEIFEQIMKREIDRIDPVRSRFGTITREEIKLEDRMIEVREEIRGLRSINFRTLLGRRKGKMNLIVTFLAILELMKTGALTIRQDGIFEDIIIDSLEQG
ncbi:MAG: segregation/condensation protein A [Eubacterium sp.]|nr:segregation/condensation protein A [Eubacterium sp.]